ncbi:Uncharacterised protein [Mycobacterium tuberculosis]|nr:Uncharacterised protein [Mycobacterium tuberculosis]
MNTTSPGGPGGVGGHGGTAILFGDGGAAGGLLFGVPGPSGPDG